MPPITTLLPALALPTLMTSGIDWTMLQQAWRVVVTTPGLPAEFVHAVRRWVYGKDPTMVVAAMMSVCAVLPPEKLARTWRPLLRGTKRRPVPDKESAH